MTLDEASTVSDHKHGLPNLQAVYRLPLDLRTRLWLQVASWLARFGYYPTMATMPSLPLEKRKRSKPPAWMNYRLPQAGLAVADYTGREFGLSHPIRVYTPDKARGNVPIVLFTHGGGFVNGGLEAMHYPCAQVALVGSAIVVSVDYPLAPEDPYPAALEAAFETLLWVSEQGTRLGGDPTKIVVMGDSAGGNLSAALCLLARTQGEPLITHQVLIYPALDATLSTPSMRAADLSRRHECDLFYGYYAGRAHRTDELISPLLAADVSALPSATVITADHDALRDDGLLYAKRLRDAGVRVRATNYLGMPHGFLSMPRLCRAAPQALAEIANELVGL
ncbi:MAG: acetyl esterase [Actinomycetota bacterium]